MNNKVRNIIQYISIVFLITACGSDATYQVKGQLDHLENPVVYAVFEKNDVKTVDTIQCIKPGHFIFQKNGMGYHSVTLFFNDRSRWLTLYLEPKKKISLSGDMKKFHRIKINGTHTNELINKFHRKNATLFEQRDQIHNLSHSSRNEKDDNIISKIADNNFQLMEKVIDFIQSHTNEEASLVLISDFFTNPDDTEKMDELLALLDSKLKPDHLFKKLTRFSERAKRTIIGAEAPDFNVKDINGKSIKLEQYKDKYIFITFTAPWCEMCDSEINFMSKTLYQYPKDSVQMLVVSLDSKKNELKKIQGKDSVNWCTIANTEGLANELVELYNINFLPYSFLIDKNKKIMIKTENSIEMKRTLEKLFN